MNVTVSLGGSRLTVSHNLTRKDVTKETESIIKLLVVDGFVKVLDKNVSDPRATKRGVTLAPHDTARSALDHGKVHGIESTFSITKLVVVHVGITKRTASYSVTADTNGSDRTDCIKDFVQQTLIDIGSEISNVERGRVEGSWFASSWSSHRGGRSGFRGSLFRGVISSSGRHD